MTSLSHLLPSFLSTNNYSLYTIPVAWLLAILPHSYAAATYRRFDNTKPRSICAKLEADQSIDKATKDRLIRCEGAQQNGFENLGFYSSAIVAGVATGVSPARMNLLALAYLISRMVYIAVYVNNRSKELAGVRSLVYVVGIGIICSMFVLAGNRL